MMKKGGTKMDGNGNLRIGWAQVDITPDRPVLLIGQMYQRLSLGVRWRGASGAAFAT